MLLKGSSSTKSKEQRPLWDDANRYSTCLRIGFEVKNKGPIRGAPGQNISVNCYCVPEEPYVFNNVPISNRLNPLFDAKRSKLQSTRKYGPPGVTTVAHNAQFFTVKCRNRILWGSLPDWFWYLPIKFCEWVVVPHLKWIGYDVYIPPCNVISEARVLATVLYSLVQLSSSMF